MCPLKSTVEPDITKGSSGRGPHPCSVELDLYVDKPGVYSMLVLTPATHGMDYWIKRRQMYIGRGNRNGKEGME